MAAHVAEDEAQGAVGQLDGIEEISAELEALRAGPVALLEDDLARRVRVGHQPPLERREQLGVDRFVGHPAAASRLHPVIVAPIAAPRIASPDTRWPRRRESEGETDAR